MTLYIIGLGLWDEKDITVKGLEAVKKCETVYLESYTSQLGCKISDLEKFYGKKVILCEREFIESKTDVIVNDAKQKDIALLIIGDPFGATTHIDYLITAKKKGVLVKIIHNASILNAIGEIGLELYKFGKTVSIPFNNKDMTSPVENIKKNLENNMHTLALLDLDPKNNKFMQIKEAAEYMIGKGLDPELSAIGIAGLGSEKPEIKAQKLQKMKTEEFSAVPQCIIIPGIELHFKEEEAISLYE